jgi:hypothetical protein
MLHDMNTRRNGTMGNFPKQLYGIDYRIGNQIDFSNPLSYTVSEAGLDRREKA